VEDAGDWTWLTRASDLATAAAGALASHPRFAAANAAEACLALSDGATVRTLNRTYRGKDKPTNVLSFPASAGTAAGGKAAPCPLGDIVLAAETVRREAEEQGLSPEHHFQHLVVHGLLHLLGLDHETEAEAEAMEGLEIEILATLGIGDPYASAGPAGALEARGAP
jgi:probable rRNA maturation factor